MNDTREFDIVVYGASGFTGRLAAHYLSRKPLRLALAGRNRSKLEAVAAGCLNQPALIIADSADSASIRSLVQRTHVVANFAGPFALYAEPVIAACAELGRHYCDITGETPFIRKMIARYQSKAEASGACLIPFAGFDSVPAELTSYCALKEAARAGYTLDHMLHYYQLRGGLNGGTLASALTMAEQGESRTMLNPNLLVDDPSWPKNPRPAISPRYEPVLDRWSAPFFMNPINTAVVRRSTFLRQKLGVGEPVFAYEERMLFGPKLAGRLEAQAATLAMGAFAGVTAHPLGRKLARRFGPQPGEGPADDKRLKNFYKGRLVGRSEERPRVLVTFNCQGDPGNETTITFASEIACLLHEEAQKPLGGGFTTPSVAFAEALLARLIATGMTMDVKAL